MLLLLVQQLQQEPSKAGLKYYLRLALFSAYQFGWHFLLCRYYDCRSLPIPSIINIFHLRHAAVAILLEKPFFRRSGVWTEHLHFNPVIIKSVGATTAQIWKPFTPTIQLKFIGGLPITCPARDVLWALIWRYVFYKMSMLVLDVLGDATVVQQKTQAAVCMFILLVYTTPCSLIKWIQERKKESHDFLPATLQGFSLSNETTC